MRQRMGLLALALSCAAAMGCGGLSTEEATQRCAQMHQADPVCTPTETEAECVTCYEECGDQCQIAESCPVQFICPN